MSLSFMLTRSFVLVIVMVVLLVVFFYRMLPELLKIIKYKIKNKRLFRVLCGYKGVEMRI